MQLSALVLSLTLVVIQLAMGQFSPRIVRALLNDRRSQWAIGVFLATIAFTLFSIRRVGEGGEVPGLTMLVAYLLPCRRSTGSMTAYASSRGGG